MLIGAFAPPDGVPGAIHISKLAAVLKDCGCDVSVVTAKADVRGALGSDWTPPVPDVYDVGCIPIGFARRLLTSTPSTVAARAPRRATLTRNLRSASGSALRSVTFGDPFLLWALVAAAPTLRVARRIRPDVVIAEYSPVGSVALGALVSRALRVPLHVFYRDVWTSSSSPKRIRSLERLLTRSTTRRYVVSEGLVAAIAPNASSPVSVVHNGYDPMDYPSPRPVPAPDRLTVTFAGKVYGGDRDLRLLAEAIRSPELSDVPLTVVVWGTAEWDAPLTSSIHRIDHRVERVPFRTTLEQFCASDVLYLPIWDQPGFLSSKLFDYVGARRWIVGAGPRTADASRLVLSMGAGELVESVDELVECLLRLWEEKRAGSPRRPSDLATAQYSRSAQFGKVAEHLVREVNQARAERGGT